MFLNVNKAALKNDIYRHTQSFMHVHTKATLKHIHQGKADEKSIPY